jgi:hypothetical protein
LKDIPREGRAKLQKRRKCERHKPRRRSHKQLLTVPPLLRMEEVDKPMEKPKPKETVNSNPTSQELSVTDTEKRLKGHLNTRKIYLA